MPKGILRYENSKCKHTVPDNELLQTYQTRMGELLQEYRVSSELQAIQRGCYFDILVELRIWFEEELEKYGVKRYNLITIKDMSEIEEFIPEKEKTEELQKKMLCVVVESIIKSVRNRCTEAKTYKTKLKSEHELTEYLPYIKAERIEPHGFYALCLLRFLLPLFFFSSFPR